MTVKYKILIAIILSSALASLNIYSKSKNEWRTKEELTNQELNNIICLTKLYGYSRYFYPNQQILKKIDYVDWYRLLVLASNEIIDLKTDIELQDNLLNFFKPIVPELSLDGSEIPQTKSKNVNCGYIWEHNGIGIRLYKNIFHSDIISYNINEKTNLPTPDSLYSLPLDGNKSAYMPLALSYQHNHLSDELRQLKKNIKKIKFKLATESFFKLAFGKPEKKFAFLQDYHFRIADIITRWNIIQHFYPYFEEDELNTKWEDILKISLVNAVKCKDQFEYYDVVCNMFSHVRDSHISINRAGYVGGIAAMYLPYYLPDIKLGWCEDKIYLKEVPDSLKNKLSVGDILISVNNISINELITRKLNLVSASTEQGKYEALLSGRLLGSFTKDSTLNLKFEKMNGEKESVIFLADYNGNITYRDEYTYFIKEIEDNIYHVNLTYRGEKATYTDFRNSIKELKKAKGIILDIRGYPDYSVTDSIITHFYQDSIKWGDFGLPIYYYPNQKETVYKRDIEYLPKSSDYIDTPLYVLINHKAMSYAETIIEILKRHKIGTLIGEPTIGTNGDVGMINLPVFGFNMTVIKDFSQYHGKGILPDIVVKRNLDAIRRGEDNILKTAINNIQELGYDKR